MLPRFEQRLGRARADAARRETAISDQRTGLEARVAFGTLLRRMLAERGVDPAQVEALRWADQAAAELALLPKPSAAQAAEAAAQAEPGDSDPTELLYARLARLAAANFADGRRPDPAGSSPAEWLAWCLVTPNADEPTGSGGSTESSV
ncbi:MAG TPA: hypothetical protein VGF34_14865 [Stellaceae bacterium]|jgi:hypothetical protein